MILIRIIDSKLAGEFMVKKREWIKV